MVSTPSRVWEISVPWNQIVSVPLLDFPSRKNVSLGVHRVEDDRDMDVLDKVVVVVRLGSDFDSPNKYVLNSSGVKVSTDGGK